MRVPYWLQMWPSAKAAGISTPISAHAAIAIGTSAAISQQVPFLCQLDLKFVLLNSLLACRVIVQKHEMPTQFSDEALPHAVSLRFYIVRALLTQIQHTGKAFICDSRDVFIQKDIFQAFDDDYLHFPRESGGYRIRGPFSENSNWITQCYGQ